MAIQVRIVTKSGTNRIYNNLEGTLKDWEKKISQNFKQDVFVFEDGDRSIDIYKASNLECVTIFDTDIVKKIK